MSARTLVVALDATDYRVFRQLEKLGLVPVLSKLAAASGIVRVSRPQGLTDDAVWASFHYACGPGGHGRYHWQRDDARARRYLFDTQGEEGLRSWWMPLAEQGHRIAIFDLPKARLTWHENLLHLADWLVHGRYGTDVKSSPPEIADEVQSRFGPMPHSYCRDLDWLDPSGCMDEIVASLLASVDLKLRAALHYLKSEDWALFATSFKEIHCISHIVSAAHIPGPDHPVAVVFAAVDRALGKLVDAAGPECRVCVYCTTGMGPNQSLDHHAPELVARLNRLIDRRWPGLGLLSRKPRPIVSQLPYNEDALTLRIQAPFGLFRKQIVDFVETCLMELRREADDAPVVLRCQRWADTYPGARARRLPDLVALLRPEIRQPEAISSRTLGHFRNAPQAIRAGNHKGDGFCILPAGEQVSAALHPEDIGPMLARGLVEETGNARDVQPDRPQSQPASPSIA
ncbi:MAG: alkaline phosphatase family protein [Rhodobiaceae bacterium]|nr:alkaline phosphatase family protein [Hyphomonas sp.]MCB9971197.1 alkaline phosphatase family protein [Hyphomonas sp.]MCC0050266.1 alkaline phosphatase family protein [Rhodobiaceae bacterium]